MQSEVGAAFPCRPGHARAQSVGLTAHGHSSSLIPHPTPGRAVQPPPKLPLLLSTPLSVNSVPQLAGKLLVSNCVASLPGPHVHWFRDGAACAKAGAV